MQRNCKYLVGTLIVLTVLLLPLATQARWISVDPKANKYPETSPYVYTLNNPLKYIDPDGQFTAPVNNPTYRGWYSYQTKSGNTAKIWAPSKSKFGKTRGGGTITHRGVDIYSPVCNSVSAPISGKARVIGTSIRGKGGNQIYISGTDNGKQMTVQLMHLNSIDIKNGQTVTEGQTIGNSGQTGNAAGQLPEEAHVHMQVKDANGNLIDPSTLTEIKTPENGKQQDGKLKEEEDKK